MSWSIVGQNIARAFIKQGHNVHLQSTNGYQYFPKDLEPYVKQNLDKMYDMQLSYTAMKNFHALLSNGDKNRFGIWNYESTIIPNSFIKHHLFCDKMLPSSNFAKKIFADNKVPESKLVTIPHGINIEEYSSNEVFKLNTKKKFKILANIAQPHIRKNIEGVFKAYGTAFTKDDDVCLVCKVHIDNAKRKLAFDVDFYRIYNDFCKKFPKHAEVEIITKFLPSMAPMYNAIDIVFSMTRAECFWIPGLEALAKNKLVIAPNWGGQLEYLNSDNSLLISGKEIRAPRAMQYWSASPYASTFDPNIEDAVNKLKKSVNEYDQLINKFKPNMESQVKRLTWDNVGKMILDLCK